MTLFHKNRLFRLGSILSLVSVAVILLSARMLPGLSRAVHQAGLATNLKQKLEPRVEKLLGDLQETSAQQEKLATIRVPPDSPVAFVTRLEALAASAGVLQTITAIPPDTDREKGTYASPLIRYRVQVECALEACERYLTLLRDLPHLVAVERVELRPVEWEDLASGALGTFLIAVAVKPP